MVMTHPLEKKHSPMKDASQQHYKVCFVACGSGGHTFPAVALAEACQEKEWDVDFLTDHRGARFLKPFHTMGNIISFPTFLSVSTRSFVGKWFLSVSTRSFVGKCIHHFFMAVESFWYMARKKIRPDLVWGFGGGMSFFPLLWARLFGIPCGIHQSDHIFGKANRWLSFFVQYTCVGYENTRNIPASVHPIIVGIPVRKAFDHAAPLALWEGPMHITILGGSQGASFWTKLFPKALALLTPEEKKNIVIVHQAPEKEREHIQKAYKALGCTAMVQPFFHNIPELFEKSHVVFSRAGALTIAELMKTGRPGFLVPYPLAKNDHQWWNAAYVSQKEGGWMCAQKEMSPEKIATFLQKSLLNPRSIIHAGKCMRHMGQTKSAQIIVELFEKILHNS